MGLAAKKTECATSGMSDHQTRSKANPLVGLTNEACVVHKDPILIFLICHNMHLQFQTHAIRGVLG